MDFMLDTLEWLQSIRTPFFTEVFTGVTILAEDYVAISVICFVFWCLSKRWGYRIGFAYLLSGVANNAVKEVFHVERPFLRDLDLVPIRAETATGYSFPSGHTQAIAALTTALATIIRKKWFTALSIVLVLLVAFSRMYLGVHTLADVLVGAALGFACAIAAGRMFTYADERQRAELLLLWLVPIAAGLIWLPSDDYVKAAGAMSSLLIGYVLDQKYVKWEAQGPAGTQIAKFVLGMAVLIGIKVSGPLLLGESMAADFVGTS